MRVYAFYSAMMKGDFFMRIMQLPHGTADYLCPVNGLADIYEWKTGERIPEQLLFYARSGFMMISGRRLVPPRMILLSTCSIGRKQYEHWSGFMDYTVHAGDGKTFRNALNDVRELIDNGIPVIIFGLDMYHLGYHGKFYHKAHVPGHVVLMVGYDDDCIYVHDNSMPEVQRISLNDLEYAWGSAYLNISKKNAYIGIDFKDAPRNSREILRKAYREMANQFLNPAVGFAGSKGLNKLISELPKWSRCFCRAELDEILRFFVMFTGSVLPELPKELDESDLSGLDNPHRGTRDRFADALRKNYGPFGNESWIAAAEHFSESGRSIEKIAEGFTRNILDSSCPDPAEFLPLFKGLLESENKAYAQFTK
jgi:hypothetical protein